MLSSTTTSVTYLPDGGAAVFPIPFPFQQEAHIHAHLRGASGTGTACRTLARGRDYAVRRSADNSGGEIVLLGDPPAPGTELVVRRLLPLTQEILFHNQGPNSPRAVEEAVDKLTMIAQQLRDSLDARTARPPEEEPEPSQSQPQPQTPQEPPASGLAPRIEAVEDAAAELSATAAGLTEGLADTNGNLAAALTDLAAVQEALAGLGALAQAEDAPPDGEAYLRRAGGWVRHTAAAGTDTGGETGGETGSGVPAAPATAAPAYPGEIRLLPFRPGELPPGWHACDGTVLPRGTPGFDAAAALPANLVTDWGVARSALRTTLPDLRGGAFRAAGVDESPGAAGGGTGGGAGAAWAMTPAMYLGAS